MEIPVVVVDDEEVDRYLVKRRLQKNQNFGDLIELSGGEKLLQKYFSEDPVGADVEPLLVLMDINMPGMDGFETIEEIQRRMSEGKGPDSIVVMMITSSGNLKDQERAEKLSVVKGFISKPLDEQGVQYILDLYTGYVSRD